MAHGQDHPRLVDGRCRDRHLAAWRDAGLAREIDPARFTFGHKSWASATRPFPRGHVYDQFRPVSAPRRPGLKIR